MVDSPTRREAARFLLGAVALLLLADPARAQVPPSALDPAAVAFFEKRVRPVLVEHCYACHSAEAADRKKLRGGLRLDTRAGLLAGGDSGPAVVPGKPTDSLLVRSLHHDGDLRMPPKGKLPDTVIADLTEWVKNGAVDPRDQGKVDSRPRPTDPDKGRTFWAYRPLTRPQPPAVHQADRVGSDIDRFLLARLERAGLSPAPEAARAVLLRRFSYDLTGLPPTPEEVDAFVRDPDPKAYEKRVDALLASPAFGERWGRHWLDVARYADSVTLRGFVFPDAWRYRDYVLDACNRDVPFDRFVREQLAGDLLPAETPADRSRQLIATTYLMLGNTNLEEQDKKQLRMDVVDEQLDVIGKGLLAQTITCARCHDHKFDPIPTRDYYALAGILRNTKVLEHANVSKWTEVPLPAPPEVVAALARHEAAVADLQGRIKLTRAKAPTADAVARGVLPLNKVPGIVVDDAQAHKVGEWKASTSSPAYIGDGYVHDLDAGKGQKTITFQPALPASGRYEVWLAYTPGSNRAERVPVTVFNADGDKTLFVDMKKNPPIQGRFVSLGQFAFEKDGQSFVRIANEGTKGHVIADAVTFIPADKVPTHSAEGPVASPEQRQALVDLAALEAELKKLQANAPKYPVAMAPLEESALEDARIHVRGSVHNLGEVAPRGVLRVASNGRPIHFPKDQSGRVQLADWIASSENPLTARVYVNRVWYWLLGDGIVRTVDNFGTTGEAPSNPELLDWIASRFIEDGWSTKKLVRRIVLSQAYRQSSTGDPRTIAADPENRLFGRANRRRLEAECLRDTLLVVSGRLTPCAGGPGFPATLTSDYGFKHSATCRSVYLPVFRNSLPELFEVFDFADPSMVTGKRNVSTVAPQALFLMNNSFVLEQSRRAADRLLAEALPDDPTRVTRAYRLTLGREPTDRERALAVRYLARTGGADGWAGLFQVLFASADFRTLE